VSVHNSIHINICQLNGSCKLRKEYTFCFAIFFSVALQSLKDLGHLTYRRFLELFRHMVGLLGQEISPSQGLYLHRTTQHRKTRTNIHALRGIRNHDPSNQLAKTHASDRMATVTGVLRLYSREIIQICGIEHITSASVHGIIVLMLTPLRHTVHTALKDSKKAYRTYY
jgi:hypothetical protein